MNPWLIEAIELACHDKSCIPPKGGSSPNVRSLVTKTGRHERYVEVLKVHDDGSMTVRAVVNGARNGTVLSATPFDVPPSRIGPPK